ncbi:MAG: DoxX family protein [Saprospiraceae bacterium]
MKKISLYAMIIFYILAGINHFWNKEFYLKMMPPWVPWHNALVILSGIGEICFAILLIFPSTRSVAAWCLIVLLIAIFPANVQMMINFWNTSNPNLWIAIVRLPLQIVLIWWAYGFKKKLK